MLANPRLAGYRTHRPNGNGNGSGGVGEVSLYPAEWDRIIDDETFRALQRRLGNEVIETEAGLRLVEGRTGRARVGRAPPADGIDLVRGVRRRADAPADYSTRLAVANLGDNPVDQIGRSN